MRKMLLAMAVVVVPLATGCCENSQTVRGQSPSYGPMTGDMCDVYGNACQDPARCRPGRGCKGAACRPYCVPSDSVYPAPWDGPAIVQYPYYTCKGPDCFFRK